MSAILGCIASPACAAKVSSALLHHDARTRTYHVQAPANTPAGRPLPLVIVLHGGGGSGKGIMPSYGFTQLVDRGLFIAVYPDAVNGSWAVGGVPLGDGKLPGPDFDDVGFIDKVVDAVLASFPIDRSRMFVTGASRGGHMTQYYVPRSRHRFAAAGVVIASGTQSIVESFTPSYPIDFGMIIGTQDPFMPYAGNSERDPRAKLMPVEAIMARYRRVLGTTETPVVETTLGDRNKADGCTNTYTVWKNERTGSRLALLKVIGGGHVVPGGRQYLPVNIVGRACSDFNHAQAMWQYFSEARPVQ
jgi:polyhydroxybutyrate depolymerase